MTGYGRSQRWNGNVKLTVELKSVNHRFCEVVVRLPKYLTVFEDTIKTHIQQHIHRGRFEVHLTTSGEGAIKRKLMVDWELFDAYQAAINQMKQRLNVDDDVSLNDLLNVPDLFEIEEETDVDQFKPHIIAAIDEALQQLIHMREKEGAALANDLKQRQQSILMILARIEQLAPKVKEAYQKRLEVRMKEFLQQRAEIDEYRILNEVAVYTDKSDIQEEITRLKSHCQQFVAIIENEGSIGRKLDFLVQEMNREANTIGSKSQSTDISHWVVDLKSEIEKMKEQIQNIE